MNTLFQDFWTISQNVQALQNQAEKKDVTPQVRVSLHKQLESLQGSLEMLRNKAQQTQNYAYAQFDEIESQIISLYRIVEEEFEKFEVKQISNETLELTSVLESGEMIKVAKKTYALLQNILFLFRHRSPSMQNRKVLHLAKKIVEEARHMLSCENANHKHIQFVLLLKTLLKEAVARGQNFINLDEANLSMDFYEIADLLQQRRKNEAKLRLKLMSSRLTEEQKRKIESSDNLIETLLELAGTEDRAVSYARLTVQGI